MNLKMILLVGAILAAVVGRSPAEFVSGSGYRTETNYANPHADESLVSFDWDADTNLYYTTGRPNWGLGFSVYRYDGAAATAIYNDATVYAGSRVTVISGRVYFNDGGTYPGIYNYFMFDPDTATAPTNMGVTSDLWGLATRDGSDVWASGGANASIYHTAIDNDGNWTSNPLVNLGRIGNYSGPLTFDQDGNLYYVEGYNADGPVVYRWSAAEVAVALTDPAGAPLNPTDHVWAVLSAGDGATGVAADNCGNLLVTATSFTAPSELCRLLAFNGYCFGYEVLGRSNERLETLRISDDGIHVSSASGIFNVIPEKTLRLVAQEGNGGALMVVGLNEEGHALRVSLVANQTQPWVVRGIDGNRVLAQAGDGGAVAIAELNADNSIANIAVLAESAPGWIARALDGDSLLAQAIDDGMVGIQKLDAGYTLGEFKVVASAAPGWIARDLSGNRLLAQAGDGGAIVIGQLSDSGALIHVTTVSDSIPGWIARGLSDNLLLAQAGADGTSMVVELDGNDLPADCRMMINPVGVSMLSLDIE